MRAGDHDGAPSVLIGEADLRDDAINCAGVTYGIEATYATKCLGTFQFSRRDRPFLARLYNIVV